MSSGLPTIHRLVPDPREALDVLDHLGVVIGGEERLALPSVRHGEEPDEVGHPHMAPPLQLGVLVPEVVDVPGLVADHQVVEPLLHHLLEQHEVGHQDLVHAAQRLKAVQVVPGRLRGDVGRLVGEVLGGGVDPLALGLQHHGHRMLCQPIDLQIGDELLQLLGDGHIAPGVPQPDRRRQVERPLSPGQPPGPNVGVHPYPLDTVHEVLDQPVHHHRVAPRGQVTGAFEHHHRRPHDPGRSPGRAPVPGIGPRFREPPAPGSSPGDTASRHRRRWRAPTDRPRPPRSPSPRRRRRRTTRWHPPIAWSSEVRGGAGCRRTRPTPGIHPAARSAG